MQRYIIFLIFIFLNFTAFNAFSIINGNPETDNYSYVVPLGNYNPQLNKFIFFCTGVKIAPDVILTAISCTNKLEKFASNFYIPNKIIHPNFFGSRESDTIKYLKIKNDPKIINKKVALLFLPEALPGPAAIIPKRRIFEALQVSQKVRIAGFGQAIAASLFSDPERAPTSSYHHKRSGVTRFMGFETTAENITLLGGLQHGAMPHSGDEGGGVFLNINTATQSLRHLIGILDKSTMAMKDNSRAIFLQNFIKPIEDALIAACDSNERTWCERKGLLFSAVKSGRGILTDNREPAKIPRFSTEKLKDNTEGRPKIKSLQLKNLGCGCQST